MKEFIAECELTVLLRNQKNNHPNYQAVALLLNNSNECTCSEIIVS